MKAGVKKSQKPGYDGMTYSRYKRIEETVKVNSQMNNVEKLKNALRGSLKKKGLKVKASLESD